jgi:hypothetical protein
MKTGADIYDIQILDRTSPETIWRWIYPNVHRRETAVRVYMVRQWGVVTEGERLKSTENPIQLQSPEEPGGDDETPVAGFMRIAEDNYGNQRTLNSGDEAEQQSDLDCFL